MLSMNLTTLGFSRSLTIGDAVVMADGDALDAGYRGVARIFVYPRTLGLARAARARSGKGSGG